jgi:hypothetical protein
MLISSYIVFCNSTFFSVKDLSSRSRKCFPLLYIFISYVEKHNFIGVSLPLLKTVCWTYKMTMCLCECLILYPITLCREVFCPIVGCGSRLASMEDFENHYNARHTASCSMCSRVYPTSRLLSIHLSEAHDSFFQAKVARGYDMVLYV